MKYSLLTTPVFISFLYVGIVATIVLVVTITTYLLIIASILRRYDQREDLVNHRWNSDIKYLIASVKKPSEYYINQHVFFTFGFFVFGLAISLGTANMVSLLNNDPVILSQLGKDITFLPVSHSSDGTLYLVAKEATYMKVIFSQQEKFVYVSSGGVIVCSGNAADICN